MRKKQEKIKSSDADNTKYVFRVDNDDRVILYAQLIKMILSQFAIEDVIQHYTEMLQQIYYENLYGNIEFHVVPETNIIWERKPVSEKAAK